MNAAVASGHAGSAAHDPARWLAEACALEAWLRERDYAGYDPFDLLSSPVVRAFTLGRPWLRAAWTQLGKRSPVQLRPLLGVRPARNAKGIGLVMSSQARLSELTGDPGYLRRAIDLGDWLERHRAATAVGAGWGYYFPWQNRAFYAPAGTPASVVTAFVAHGLLDVAESLERVAARGGLSGTGAAPGVDEAGVAARMLNGLAGEAGVFLGGCLERIPGEDGTFCFSYTPLDRRGVHNASLLTASVLARLASRGASGGDADAALAAARYTAARQRADGSWPYGIGRRDGWVDSYHTSYNLVALHQIGRYLGTIEFDGIVKRGLAYWRREFLRGRGVTLYAGRAYPQDVHAVAHALVALRELAAVWPGSALVAQRLAVWAVEEMKDPDGHFHHQRHRRYRNRLPYTRWVQAWMLRGLTAQAEAPPARSGTPGAMPYAAAPARPA
jgi:polysaccharide biosynthesis protein VpsJ